MKCCWMCKTTKGATEFHRCSSTRDGLQGMCKSCAKMTSRDRDRRGYRKNQSDVIALYGGKCECCGETEHKFLEIDHIEGGGSKFRRANKDMEGFYRMLKREHPDGYRVLCSNCNHGRWRNGGRCPHEHSPVTSEFGFMAQQMITADLLESFGIQ